MDALLDYRNPPRDYHRKRPRWFHSLMIDWMMAHPGGSMEDLAKHVNRKLPTISAIVRSDLFQAALAQRKREFSQLQDERVRDRLVEVTEASLDTILKVIEKKKDTLPFDQLTSLADKTLQRLGYGVQPAGNTAVQVNVNQGQPVATPVSATELQEARDILRQNQQRLADASPPSPRGVASSEGSAPLTVEYSEVPEKGAAPAAGREEGDSVAPALRKA